MTCDLLRDQALISVLQPPWEHGSERSKITHRSATFWEWQSNEKEAWAKITKDHYVRDINVSCVQDIAILILYFHSQTCFLSNRIPTSGESCGMSYLFLYPSPVNVWYTEIVWKVEAECLKLKWLPPQRNTKFTCHVYLTKY